MESGLWPFGIWTASLDMNCLASMHHAQSILERSGLPLEDGNHLEDTTFSRMLSSRPSDLVSSSTIIIIIMHHMIIAHPNSEFNARIMLLSRTVLSPANFNALLSECNATLNQAELNEASGNGAFYPDIYQKMGDWNQARWNYVTSTYASSATSDNLNVCPSKPATTTTTTAASFIRAPGTPNTPSNPASTSSSITIGWETPNSNGNAISSFTVQRRSVSGDWTTIYTGLDRSFEDTGLTTGDSLTYRVKATNSQGDSAWSNEATYVVGTASTTGDVNVGTPTTGDNVINNESSSAIGVSVSITLSFFICLFF